MPDDVFIEPVQEATEALAEVKRWFERARLSACASINLYFEPYNKQFRKLAKPVKVMGHEVGLYLHDSGLYRITQGPGDCEETLWYIGRRKRARTRAR